MKRQVTVSRHYLNVCLKGLWEIHDKSGLDAEVHISYMTNTNQEYYPLHCDFQTRLRAGQQWYRGSISGRVKRPLAIRPYRMFSFPRCKAAEA